MSVTMSQPSSTRTGSSSAILIVDGYGHSREGLGASLRAAGFEVETAGSAWHAITRMKDERIGIAIIDIDFPSSEGGPVGGWDLVRIFRAFHPGAPVILITTERWRPPGESATVEFLEKPIDPRAVRALVRALGAAIPRSEEAAWPTTDARPGG